MVKHAEELISGKEVDINNEETFDALASIGFSDFKMKASQGADEIMCEEDTWKIFALETTLSVQKEMYGNSAGAHSDVTDVKNELKEAYETYFKEHPSEALLQSDSIYIFGNMYDGLTDDPENWSNDYWWQSHEPYQD